MKKFLLKTILYFVVLFAVVLGAIKFYSKGLEFPFFSDSISYNAKIKFLADNKINLKEYPIIVIGSSMSLNNIDCITLSNKLNQPIINISSWGRKFSDFNDFDIWEKNKTIITGINFTDINNTYIVKKTGFPYSESKLINLKNIMADFPTYKSQINDYFLYLSYSANNRYSSLKFDKTGTVLFGEKQDFFIDSTRWNSKQKKINDEDINAFITNVKQNASKVKNIIISFSPSRQSIYSVEDSKTVKRIQDQLEEVPNVFFINNYDDVNFNDDDFVDFCHFSREGTKKYIELLYSSISEKRIF